MLTSLTRVGGIRLAIGKAVAVPGDVRIPAARADGAPVSIKVEATDGRIARLEVGLVWAGSLASRQDLFGALASAVRELQSLNAPAHVVPVGVELGDGRPPLAGDSFAVECVSVVEQEVLCNLLRVHAPTLIAASGRGVVGTRRPRDTVGSRWLLESREHLATRYLASTSPVHLQRVISELRRRDGVERLDRMDISPVTIEDTPAVSIRCIDSQSSLAGTRAFAIVIAALTLRARRLVRDGRRQGNAPQRLLDDNRARAIGDGLRATFRLEDSRGDRHDRVSSGGRAATVDRPARLALRDLLDEIAPELASLEVIAPELAPLILPLELGRIDPRWRNSRSDALAWGSHESDAKLAALAAAALVDERLGQPHIELASAAHAGLVDVALGSWDDRIAGKVGRRGEGPRTGRAGGNQGGRRRKPNRGGGGGEAHEPRAGSPERRGGGQGTPGRGGKHGGKRGGKKRGGNGQAGGSNRRGDGA